MKIKKIINTLVLCVASSSAISAWAESSVWKVTKGDKFFYIGGTVHLLSSSDLPLPKEFSTAYNNSDEIIFETDTEVANSLSSQQKLIAAMTLPGDQTLRTQLSPKAYQALNTFFSERNLPLASFEKFKPWGVSLLVSVLEYQRWGLQAEFGVETVISELAQQDNKPLQELESFDEQLSFFKSMEAINNNQVIEYTLSDLEQLPEFITDMRQNWRSGNLEQFLENASIKEMKTKFPKMYNTLILNRNNRWISQLDELNNDNKVEFVLVGSLHLPGEDGVLNKLQKKGYKVEQLNN
ncbi:TraB/GumN family protein [Sessilibacter sp. MAH4]